MAGKEEKASSRLHNATASANAEWNCTLYWNPFSYIHLSPETFFQVLKNWPFSEQQCLLFHNFDWSVFEIRDKHYSATGLLSLSG